MPYISTQISTSLSPDKETTLKTKFGNAIKLLGKTESWLMLSFEDNCRLWFQGNQEKPCAFVVVKLFGKASPAAYEKMTAELTRILQEELALDPTRIYVQYEEVSHWGWNAGNL
uniref:phenylpyruvate tautomerase MIF-related protein n=1 Tax=Candidatus Fimivicinus sp. TaxID=3056640 RepID=UPI003FEFFC97